MLPDRRHAPRFVAAITLAMGVMGVAAAQPDGGETLRMVGTLPATARVVIAADSLGAEGARAAVRGLAAFLSDAGALGRSRDAWTSLGVAVGAEPGAAFGELLGTRAVLVIGDGGGREDPYAVLSELAPEFCAEVRMSDRDQRFGPFAEGLSMQINRTILRDNPVDMTAGGHDPGSWIQSDDESRQGPACGG